MVKKTKKTNTDSQSVKKSVREAKKPYLEDLRSNIQLIEILESPNHYNFYCQGGPLSNCHEWIELKGRLLAKKNLRSESSLEEMGGPIYSAEEVAERLGAPKELLREPLISYGELVNQNKEFENAGDILINENKYLHKRIEDLQQKESCYHVEINLLRHDLGLPAVYENPSDIDDIVYSAERLNLIRVKQSLNLKTPDSLAEKMNTEIDASPNEIDIMRKLWNILADIDFPMRKRMLDWVEQRISDMENKDA